MMQRQLSLSFKAWVDATCVRVALKRMAKAVCRRLMQWRAAAVLTHWKVTFISHSMKMSCKVGQGSASSPHQEEGLQSPCNSLWDSREGTDVWPAAAEPGVREKGGASETAAAHSKAAGWPAGKGAADLEGMAC